MQGGIGIDEEIAHDADPHPESAAGPHCATLGSFLQSHRDERRRGWLTLGLTISNHNG